MDARPDWVTEWVWEEYLPLIDASEPQCLALQCVTDLRCKCVWDALDARRKGKGFVPADEFDRAVDPDIGEATSLLKKVAYFARGVPGWETVPRTQRHAQGTRIARLACDLRDAISALPHDRDLLVHPYFTSLFYDLAAEFARDGFVSEGTHDLRMDPKWQQYIAGFHSGATFAMDKIDRVLDMFARAANDWAESRPPVTHLSNPNVERLYFLRKITAYFKKQYDMPLREQSAALACVMFDCDIDGNTVAKLAP